MRLPFLFLFTAFLPGLANAAPLDFDAGFASVQVDPAAGSFSARFHLPGNPTLSAGKLPGGTGGTAKLVDVADSRFGTGKAVDIAYPNGNRDSLAAYPGLPFLLFRSVLRNPGDSPLVLNRVAGPSAAVQLGRSPAALRTLGTGGLLEPAQNPGSYAFLAVVDPATRSGIVGGWLTHDRGSGVVFSPVAADTVTLDAALDYGRLRIAPRMEASTETFALGAFADARLGLEAYADAVARQHAVRLPPQPSGYCTWYMEKHGGACDERFLAELSAYAAEHLKPFGFDFVQIDDGWQDGIKQNGPKKNFTTHASTGPYPTGMKAAADSLKQHGFTPGIWFMPFAGTHDDPFFQAHADWFARGPDGKPYDTPWGGTCLDMTHPGARSHLAGVVRQIAQDWGYTLFKMDGLWTGTATRQIYVNDGYRDDAIGEATLHDPAKTNIEAFRDGLKLVRQAAGPRVFLLGCCVSQNMRSFGGSFGLLDAMRVGPDTGAGHIGAPHASRLWFLNGRVWWNDPDCVSVRNSTPLDQARLNATFTTIAGDLFYNSDWIPDLPPERLDILQRCMPAHGLASRPVDVFENQPARLWLLSDTRATPRRDVVALYNWDKQATLVDCPAERIGLPPAAEYIAFDFWANKFVPPFRGSVRADLPAGSCRVLAIRPVADHPQLLSTSRHVTQGIIDVSNEKWDPAARVLSGVSRLVANDSCELRIVAPVGEHSWKATAVRIAAGSAKVSFAQDGPRLRATLLSPVSGEVRWEIGFEPCPIAASAPAPATNLQASADRRGVALHWTDSGADRYRILREPGGLRFESPTSRFADAATEPGSTYSYQVSALGWDGRASTPATVQVSTPAQLKRPPAPPAPTHHLSDLNFSVPKIGWGKPGVNRSVEGKPLTLEGQTYAKGLGLHATAVVVCPVPPGARRFVAIAGLDDEKKSDPRASVTFQIHGDVKEMGEPPTLLAESPILSAETLRSWAFDLELNSRFKELRLVITDAGDGIASDHADWVNAGFLP